ncbi:hypothetical protein HDU76_006959, partial [Blyttiomyces sp. JEL0837]
MATPTTTSATISISPINQGLPHPDVTASNNNNFSAQFTLSQAQQQQQTPQQLTIVNVNNPIANPQVGITDFQQQQQQQIQQHHQKQQLPSSPNVVTGNNNNNNNNGSTQEKFTVSASPVSGPNVGLGLGWTPIQYHHQNPTAPMQFVQGPQNTPVFLKPLPLPSIPSQHQQQQQQHQQQQQQQPTFPPIGTANVTVSHHQQPKFIPQQFPIGTVSQVQYPLSPFNSPIILTQPNNVFPVATSTSMLYSNNPNNNNNNNNNKNSVVFFGPPLTGPQPMVIDHMNTPKTLFTVVPSSGGLLHPHVNINGGPGSVVTSSLSTVPSHGNDVSPSTSSATSSSPSKSTTRRTRKNYDPSFVVRKMSKVSSTKAGGGNGNAGSGGSFGKFSQKLPSTRGLDLDSVHVVSESEISAGANAGTEVKIFKCPTPLCTKSYKNPNGLKYHLERGLCETDDLVLESNVSDPTQSNVIAATDAEDAKSSTQTTSDSSTPPATPPTLAQQTSSVPNLPPLISTSSVSLSVSPSTVPSSPPVTPPTGTGFNVTGFTIPSMFHTFQVSPSSPSSSLSQHNINHNQNQNQNDHPLITTFDLNMVNSSSSSSSRKPRHRRTVSAASLSTFGSTSPGTRGTLISGSPCKQVNRPWICRVSQCGKRYQHLNGLKYHARAAHPDLDFREEILAVIRTRAQSAAPGMRSGSGSNNAANATGGNSNSGRGDVVHFGFGGGASDDHMQSFMDMNSGHGGNGNDSNNGVNSNQSLTNWIAGQQQQISTSNMVVGSSPIQDSNNAMVKTEMMNDNRHGNNGFMVPSSTAVPQSQGSFMTTGTATTNPPIIVPSSTNSPISESTVTMIDPSWTRLLQEHQQQYQVGSSNNHSMQMYYAHQQQQQHHQQMQNMMSSNHHNGNLIQTPGFLHHGQYLNHHVGVSGGVHVDGSGSRTGAVGNHSTTTTDTSSVTSGDNSTNANHIGDDSNGNSDADVKFDNAIISTASVATADNDNSNGGITDLYTLMVKASFNL